MKILVGYDGLDSTRSILSVAMTHAKAFQADVHVVASLIKGTENELQEIENTKEALKWIETEFEEKKIFCKTHLLIRGLAPGEDIVTFAKEIKADEIIIGVRHRSRVGKMVFGSTAQFIILNASCPVVTVKQRYS